MDRGDALTGLLLQMVVVMLTTLIAGWAVGKLGQPRVIGEIIGGILLGPSILGRLAPSTTSWLFPQSSLAAFDILSTIGLILFLFLIGAQIDLTEVRRHSVTASLASISSVVLPFVLGIALAPMLRSRFAPVNFDFLAFSIFLGVSMSITAFPVLARIIEERQLENTALGTIALMSAAIDDVLAWILLALPSR
jgi:Kef-type K+ transport system membrane component KefB